MWLWIETKARNVVLRRVKSPLYLSSKVVCNPGLKNKFMAPQLSLKIGSWLCCSGCDHEIQIHLLQKKSITLPNILTSAWSAIKLIKNVKNEPSTKSITTFNTNADSFPRSSDLQGAFTLLCPSKDSLIRGYFRASNLMWITEILKTDLWFDLGVWTSSTF